MPFAENEHRSVRRRRLRAERLEPRLALSSTLQVEPDPLPQPNDQAAEDFWFSGWVVEQAATQTPAADYGADPEPNTPEAAGGQIAHFRYRFSEPPQLEPMAGGYRVTMEGESSWIRVGDPIVPNRTSHILLPPGTQIESVEVTRADPVSVGAGVSLITPSPRVQYAQYAEDLQWAAEADSKSLQHAVTFENQWLRGYSIGVLNVFPVAYQADTAEVSWCDEIWVTVTVGATDAEELLPLRGSAADQQHVLDLVDNDSAISAYKPAPGVTPAGAGPLPSEGPYEYVIVTPAELSNAFRPLVEHKLSRGLSATIVTTEYVESHYRSAYANEDDPAGRLREFIRDAYLRWNTSWVLIGGDEDVAPHRYVRVQANGEQATFLSDMYFACLDGPYNETDDSAWGQTDDGINGGDVDRMPDVFVGRAPASNAAEVTRFVEKTILYETRPPLNPTTALWMGEGLDVDPVTWGAESSEQIIAEVIPAEYTNTTLFERDTSYTRADVMAELNASPHIVHYLGHANYNSSAKMNVGHPPELINEHPYVFYSQGCLDGAFQYESMAEAHTVQSDHGAVAAILNTHYGWYNPGGILGGSHWWAWEFFDALFNEGLLHVGEAHFDSKTDRPSEAGTGRWVFFASTLFGDPELRIFLPRSAPPTVLSAVPDGLQAAPVSSVKLEFSEPMDRASFKLTDVASFVGPDGSDLKSQLSGFQWRDFWTLEIFFRQQSAAGTYQLTIGPEVSDHGGTAADFDNDGVAGEVADDRLAVSFELPVGLGDDPSVVYRTDMSAAPEWTFQGQWALGQPSGEEGDPASGRTGPYVLGYNLNGAYQNNMPSTQYAVSPPIDCAAYAGVTLHFWRWLGVENASWDHATIDVSNDDGLTWTPVWENGLQDIVEAGWSRQAVDLSAVADGQPAVRIRFGMGPTDTSTVYHGWNIDDLVVSGTPASPIVVGRHTFYNHSAFDSGDPQPGASDDLAIAPDKAALLPGETASFANYTSYSLGINGIMIDVAHLPGTPTLADFRFRLGNDSNPSTWRDAPPPESITVRRGQGIDGSDRLTIIWPDHAIENRWLEVTVRSTADTGLATEDVFYFGNAVGESGDSAAAARVDATDMLVARDNPRSFLSPAPIDSRCDYDRDGRVDAVDLLLARDNQSHFGSALKLISIPEAFLTPEEAGDVF